MGRTARFRNGAVYVLAYKGEEELFKHSLLNICKGAKITGFNEKIGVVFRTTLFYLIFINYVV